MKTIFDFCHRRKDIPADSFKGSDFVTPVVLQKVQPLIAVAGARIVLGERPRSNFAQFLVALNHPRSPTPS